MRATAVGRDAGFGHAALALGILSLGAAVIAVALAWEVLVDPLAVAQIFESLVSRP